MLWHSFPELWGIEPRKGPGQWGQKEPQLMRWDQNGCRPVALLREEGAGDPFIPDASKREECAETNMSPFLVSPPRCAVPSANTWAGPRSLALPPLHLFFLPPTSTCLLADSECWVPRAFLSWWGSGGGVLLGTARCVPTLYCALHLHTQPRRHVPPSVKLPELADRVATSPPLLSFRLFHARWNSTCRSTGPGVLLSGPGLEPVLVGLFIPRGRSHGN